MRTLSTFSHFANDALLAETIRLAGDERLATGRLIAALAEVDARRLYLGEGCSSLFVYCTHVLHLSEHAAYSRIEAARAARRHPLILDLLIAGDVTLTTISLLAPHLTGENCKAILEAARHKSKREVEAQVAALRPLPAVAPSVRRLPTQQSVAPLVPKLENAPATIELPAAPAARAAVVKALAPEQYKVQFTISRETHEKLRRVQDLLRHSIPDGDPAQIFDKAMTLLLADVEKKKLGAASKPRSAEKSRASRTRYVPAAVKREVWKRDAGQCAFVGSSGRCDERGFLEFHHRKPFASGGPTTSDNLELRCRAHNAYEAELFFGPFVAREERVEFVGTRSGPSSDVVARSDPFW